ASPTFPLDVHNGTAKIDGPELQGALAKMQELTEKGFFNQTALTSDWPQSADIFTSGKAAMIAQGTWMPGVADGDFKDKGYDAFEVGFFPVPNENGIAVMQAAPNESLSVNAK